MSVYVIFHYCLVQIFPLMTLDFHSDFIPSPSSPWKICDWQTQFVTYMYMWYNAILNNYILGAYDIYTASNFRRRKKKKWGPVLPYGKNRFLADLRFFFFKFYFSICSSNVFMKEKEHSAPFSIQKNTPILVAGCGVDPPPSVYGPVRFFYAFPYSSRRLILNSNFCPWSINNPKTVFRRKGRGCWK